MTPAPASVVVDGQPAHGRYAGAIARIAWAGVHPRPGKLWQWLHYKRWHYVGLGDGQFFIGVAIVDLGWACSAFAYLFDRAQRRLLADWSQDGLPGLQAGVSNAPLAGAHTWFRGAGASLSLRDVGGRLQLSVATRALRIEAELDLAAMPPPLLAVGPVEGGLAHATQKTTALPVRGHAEAGGRRFGLDGAWAAIDASSGLLARHTAWRWASAHGPGVGFNLQAGYFGGQENLLWLDGQPIPLGAATFDFNPAQPLRPWLVHTDDGLLDLVFTPEGARCADRNLGFAASRYVQPIGQFTGFVKAAAGAPARRIKGLLGVTEDHVSRW